MTWDLIVSILSIIVINIVLSGDNALVIGMASRRLDPTQRRKAIILGGGGAILLRIGFTALAVYLLKIPFLQVAGGVILTWIAYQVLKEEDEEKEVRAGESLWFAVRTIITADVVMSLDNVLAIAGAAHGSYILYIAGVALSMPPILFGSELLARLMNRFPFITIIGAVVLTITAARMIVDEQAIDHWLGSYHLIGLIGVAIVLTLAVLIPYGVQQRRKALDMQGAAVEPGGEPAPPVERAGQGSQSGRSRADTVE